MEIGGERTTKQQARYATGPVALLFYDSAARLPAHWRLAHEYSQPHDEWVAEAGDFGLLIGTSSADLPRTARVHLTREWTHPTTGSRRPD